MSNKRKQKTKGEVPTATPPLGSQERERAAARAPVRLLRAAPPAAAPRPGLLQPALLVALAAVLIYLNGIPGGFVFDDKLIQRDPRIHGETSFWTIFITDYWYKYIGTSADLYRPLTIASYALNFAVAGLSAPAFHAVNVLLHAAVCVLVVALVDALFRDRGLAVVSGLLFATHPVHTEAVTGIVGRAEILTALFLLAALYLHCRDYALWDRSRRFWLPVALLAYLCALLSKETAIVGVGLLLLIDYIRRPPPSPLLGKEGEKSRASPPSVGGGVSSPPCQGGARGGWSSLRPMAAVWGLYAGVAVLYVGIRFSVVGQFIQKPPPRSYLLLFGQPLVTRVCTALEILAIYLRLLIFPATLSADYSYRQVPIIDSPGSAAAVVGLLAGVALCGAFVWALRRRAWPAVFALGFFAVGYALIGNLLVPLQILVAERLLYLPSLGFCVGVAWLWLQVAQRCAAPAAPAWLRRVPAAIVAGVVLLYSARTVARNFDWRDNETLYAATVRASPECFAAHFNYSAILMQQPGKIGLALEELLKAYAIRQDHYPSLVNLSSAYLNTGQPEKAREIALQGLKIRPDGRELRQLLEAAEARLRSRS